jgi:hypothetical protein
MQLVKLSILGFIAGFLAVPMFHQSLWYLLNLVGLIPLDRPAWTLAPIPPYGVPSVSSMPGMRGNLRMANSLRLAACMRHSLGSPGMAPVLKALAGESATLFSQPPGPTVIICR